MLRRACPRNSRGSGDCWRQECLPEPSNAASVVKLYELAAPLNRTEISMDLA